MIPSDPSYSQQWHFDHLGNIEKIWDEYSGAGIAVGVYDSGIESDHPDLAANYDPSLHVIINGNPLSGEPHNTTDAAHGTGVAGILAASANNGLLGNGVAWGASLTSVNILDPASNIYLNSTDPADFLSALQQMTNFDVVNHSWNGTDPQYFADHNLFGGGRFSSVDVEFGFVLANGRDGLGTILVQGVANNNADAQYSGLNVSRHTITVAAIQEDGSPWQSASNVGSNYGACVLVTAPGKSVYTTDLTGADGGNPGGDFGLATGTSFATPIVSGIVALMLDANPGLGWRDVQNILAASAKHTGSDSGDLGSDAAHANENGEWFLNEAANWNGGGMHFSNDYGYGLVDAYAAVRMAEVWSLFTTGQTSSNEKDWENTNASPGDPTIEVNGTATANVSIAPTPFTIAVEHVDVEITLTHSDFTKLRIFLVAPSGNEVELFDGSGGTDAVADAGLTWIYGVDALRGENATGTWTVRVENTSGSESGTLTSVKVTAYGSAASTNDAYHYTDEFLAMKALSGQAGRATLADTNGGTDWIDAAAVTGNIALNLNTNIFTKVNGANWFKIAAGTQIERAVTGDGNDTLTGNGVANKLHGMRGNDALDGGLGNDNMFGGKGSDTYTVAQSGDVADETGGNGADTVKAGITFSLADTTHAKGSIEHLTLTGTGAINATGNGSANTLTGNGAANTLDGLGNNDLMRGMGGNDTYTVAQSGDVVDETGGSGTDLVKSAIGFSLANTARVKGSVENLTLTGSAKIDATGNGLANLLLGNAGANIINGLAGNDRMTGGGNADTFAFDTALNPTTNVDHVTDFLSGLDTLRLDATVFAKLKIGDLKKKAFFAKDGASKAKDKHDRVIYDSDSGEVRFDKDGKGKTKAVLVAVLDGGPDLAHTDIMVVA